MNSKTDFRISLRQRRLVKYICSLEKRLHVSYETLYPICSVSGQISAKYQELQDTVIFGLKRLSYFLFCILLHLLWFKQYLFEFNTGIYYIDIQTIHIEDLNESLRLI